MATVFHTAAVCAWPQGTSIWRAWLEKPLQLLVSIYEVDYVVMRRSTASDTASSRGKYPLAKEPNWQAVYHPQVLLPKINTTRCVVIISPGNVRISATNLIKQMLPWILWNGDEGFRMASWFQSQLKCLMVCCVWFAAIIQTDCSILWCDHVGCMYRVYSTV